MKSALRAMRIGRVLLRYRLDDLLDDTPAERWLRLMRPFVPSAAPSIAGMPRGARLSMQAGTALFLASDTVLAFQEFVLDEPRPGVEAAVMTTYTAAQGLIAVGAARAG